MNSHVKRWIDEIISSMEIGQVSTADSIKTLLIELKGTAFVCDSSAIGWYVKRHPKIKTLESPRSRRTYVRI